MITGDTAPRLKPRWVPGGLRWEANAFVGFFERQINLYKRYWTWEVAWFLYGLISVLSIGYLASGLSALGFETRHVNIPQTQCTCSPAR